MASGVRRSRQSLMERQLPELLSLKECRQPCYEMEGQLMELPQDEVQQQAERTSEELDEAEGISDELTDEQYSVLLAMTEKAIRYCCLRSCCWEC